MEAPIYIGQLELTEPIADLELPPHPGGGSYTGARLLVRMQRAPVGYVHLGRDTLTGPGIARQVWATLGTAINSTRAQAGLAALGELPVTGIQVEPLLTAEAAERPLVSVVICSRDRPESLLRTLRDVAALNYSPFEVVVVDNAPTSEATRTAVREEFADDARFHYVREPRPGLSCARNRGLAEATADIVAFTDDDVRVDPWWLDGIVRGFQAAPDVACVTGLIATAQLDNAIQLYFHLRAGWGENCQRRVFDLTVNRDDSPLYPYAVGAFGAGANFAISRIALKDIGGFNEALGAGTPAGGGEDLNIFMRVILSGHRLVYEPSAVVWHVHRAELTSLAKQLRAYGTGCTAAMTAIVLASPRARRELPAKVITGVLHMVKLTDGVREERSSPAGPALPSGLIKQEAIGLLLGPWRYALGKRNLKRLARPAA
jgi:GT2 family glycosyltransferase